MDVTLCASLVQDYYDHIDAGDIASALLCFAPDAVYRRPGYPALVGLKSISDYYRNTRVIGSGRHSIEVLIAGAGEIAVRGRFDGRSRSDEPISARFADFWRFAGQLVIERDTYFDAALV